MSAYASVDNTLSQGLFSPDEIRHLMRVEYQRALRYDYPITMMLIEVDRLEALSDLYGSDSRQEILEAVVSLLRVSTRRSDFLGCMRGERIMTLFPHTPRSAVTPLAGRLLAGCRDLVFRTGRRVLRVTLSIGVTTPRGGEADFERFVSFAEEALAHAVRTGGDRFVESAGASELIDALREQLEDEERSLAEADPATPAGRSPGELRERIRDLFRALGQASPEMRRLERDVAAAAEEGLVLARHADPAGELIEQEEQIETLEQRVQKLKQLLDDAQRELARIAERKGLDSGVASIYRAVQGLDPGDAQFERKKEVLTLMFEANLALRKKFEGPS